MPFFVQEPNEPKRKEPPTNLAVTVHLFPPFFCVRVLRSIPFYEGFLRRDEDVVFAAAFGWLDYPEGADGGYGHVVWGAFNAKSLDFYRCRVSPLSFGDWERLREAVLKYLRDSNEANMMEVAYFFAEAFDHAFNQDLQDALSELMGILQSLMTLRYLKNRPDPEEVKLAKWKLLSAPTPKRGKRSRS